MSSYTRDFFTEEDNIFIEQAEYIDEVTFLDWSIDQPDENTIIRKLSQGGAKLITGPRGCGKTTLMLKTFHQLRASSKATSLPIYVNFKTSLKLEPLYKKGNINAVFWFNQWLLFKVYQGFFQILKEVKQTPSSILKFNEQFVDRVINKLEFAQTDKLSDEEDDLLTISSLEEDIQKVLKLFRKTRCVLLLDDAAHAFSPEQQRDFFDFFRQIKSRIISPKAAIYPGVTIYSSRFHVGHDAEEIDIWIKPDSSDYLDFMFKILKQRLPSEVYNTLLANTPLLQLVCYAAFGIPRALLNMIRSFYNNKLASKHGEFEIKFNRQKVFKAIKDSFENTFRVYSSLRVQLPIYEKFILTGEQLFDSIINKLKEYNKNKEIGRQSISIGIKHPLPAEFSKVLGFFQYVGILLPQGKINRGEQGAYEIYVIHYAALILRNVLFSKSPPVADLSNALINSSPSHYPKIIPNSLIGTDDFLSVFKLALPPCQNCGTLRPNEHAKFCINCGSILKTGSTFEEIVKHDIEKLGLTKKRVETIKKHSQINIIKDLLMDHDNQELRGVPGIGEIWAKRISSRAEEYIS